jgi:potassium-dependent mechanosensitive channel
MYSFTTPGGSRRSSRRRCHAGHGHRGSVALWIFLGFLLLSVSLALAQQGASSNPLASIIKERPKASVVPPELPPTFPEQTTAIPLPDVASRSLELGQMLRDAAAKLPTREQIDAIQSSINDLAPDLQSKVQDVNAMLSGSPNSLEVREEENYWHGVAGFANTWEQQLLTWANNAQATVNMLDSQEPAWAATLEENKNNKDLGPVLAVVESNLRDIRKLRTQAQEALQLAVNMQINVGTLDQTTEDVIAKLNQARIKLKGRLLDRDSLPLWKIEARREVGESRTVFGSVHSRWIAIVAFVKENEGVIAFDFFLLIMSLMLAKRLCVMTQAKQPTNELETEAYRVFSHWVAVGLLPPMIVGYFLAPSAPVTLVGLLILVSFFPVLVILPPLLNRQFQLLLYFFAVLYTFNWLLGWMGLSPSSRREVQFIADAILLTILTYLAWPSSERPATETGWGRTLLNAIRFAIALLAISMIADLFGYVKLAHYLAIAVVYSAFVAVCVLTALRVCSLLLNVGLSSPLAERLAAVRLHRHGIVRWLPRVLMWTGIAIWAIATLDLAGLDTRFYDGLNKFFDFRISGSDNGATLGGVLGFFIIIVVGYGIASAIRFFFREEVFRRVHMSRGLPELIASIIYYVLMVIVFLAAINVGGIELNKLTVLTGAIGVGLGFGMQQIVNNFVSGLILQFERPIHIDDIIEVDTNTGKVTRIGIRSSTIQTFQGAEVIVPNASLISSKVINWTLSESQRRRELPVGVAYGSDPKLVLKLLLQAAAKHELVLTKPEPNAYFLGFGDSSLNFELHFWVMQENNGLLITSEVAQCVMQLLDDAGIEIPFPQRDLHLRSVDPGAAGLLAQNTKS